MSANQEKRHRGNFMWFLVRRRPGTGRGLAFELNPVSAVIRCLRNSLGRLCKGNLSLVSPGRPRVRRTAQGLLRVEYASLDCIVYGMTGSPHAVFP